MDFLLIVIGIGGLVFAGVMLVLASRASRRQLESDARVEELHTLAVGSVLFAHDDLAESPAGATPLRDDRPQPAHDQTFDVPVQAYPFVMTVPARAGRGPASFDRTPGRSRS